MKLEMESPGVAVLVQKFGI